MHGEIHRTTPKSGGTETPTGTVKPPMGIGRQETANEDTMMLWKLAQRDASNTPQIEFEVLIGSSSSFKLVIFEDGHRTTITRPRNCCRLPLAAIAPPNLDLDALMCWASLYKADGPGPASSSLVLSPCRAEEDDASFVSPDPCVFSFACVSSVNHPPGLSMPG